MKNDHYRISQTAILCADVRALATHIPYATVLFEEVAQNAEGRMNSVVSHWLRKWFLRVPFLKSMVAKISLLEGRYYANNEAVDQLFGKEAPILEIAAGLSTRALHLGGTRLYLETDLTDLIEQKRRISEAVLRKVSKQESSRLVRLAVNALDYEQLKSAAQILRAQEPTKPFVVLHEGMIMYFDDEEQAHFRDNMRRLLEEFNPRGAWITTDFALRPDKKGFLRRLMGKLEKNTGRPFNYFESDAEVAEFLAQGGLRVEFRPNEHIAQGLSCIDKIGLKPADVLLYAPEYRAAVVTLAERARA